MAKDKGFTIELTSRYDGWWRYNTALMCGCFDSNNHRTEFLSAESHVAAAGSALTEKPAGVDPARVTALTTPVCEYLMLYVYIIPHTLPATDRIDATKPFEVTLRISYGGQVLRTEKRMVNQWSGASIEMRVEKQ